MKGKIFINIRWLLCTGEDLTQKRGSELQELNVIANAYLRINSSKIDAYGPMHELVFPENDEYEIIDLSGRSILPCWVDSHTHLVHARSREDEFVMKLKGKSYQEIAAAGGGILNSATHIDNISEEDLFALSLTKLKEVISMGTGGIEIKSGYGLSRDGELKMLRVIKQLKAEELIPIKATFLGAHTYPGKYKNDHKGYIDILIKELLPVIAKEALADYIDVFCETGFFSPDETIEICEAAASYGILPRLHVNQMNSIGGIEAGLNANAISLDHLETLTPNDIKILGEYRGHATLLPTAAFFLRMQYQPARELINAGAAVTLASDYNPGSSPSANMHFVGALSCIQLKMLPEEVLNASTINGAYALGLEKSLGSISIGKLANFIVTRPEINLNSLYYNFAGKYIESVYISGQMIHY